MIYIKLVIIMCLLILILFLIKIISKNISINNYKYETFLNENDILKNKRVVIGGCAMNIEKYIKKSLNKMKDMSSFFKDYRIVIFENDSTDNTLRILREFEKNNKNVKIISEMGLSKRKGFTRTCKLAYARNKILEFIEKENLDDYDLFINMDLDNININLNVNNLKHILETTDLEWDVLTANQKDYYDYWALRTNKYNKNCWDSDGLCSIKKKVLSNWFDIEQTGNSETSISIKSKPIEVLSAFGGLGIYKINSFKGCKYSSNFKHNIRRNDCEHVIFHKCITDKGGKIYILPKLLNNN